MMMMTMRSPGCQQKQKPPILKIQDSKPQCRPNRSGEKIYAPYRAKRSRASTQDEDEDATCHLQQAQRCVCSPAGRFICQD